MIRQHVSACPCVCSCLRGLIKSERGPLEATATKVGRCVPSVGGAAGLTAEQLAGLVLKSRSPKTFPMIPPTTLTPPHRSLNLPLSPKGGGGCRAAVRLFYSTDLGSLKGTVG